MTEKQNYRVLVVDDDPSINRLLNAVLSHEGYHVEVCSSGEEALAIIQREPPDIVITDWDMPGISGTEICRQLRSENIPRYIYVLLMTGKTRSDSMTTALESGADDFLVKPIQMDELIARLKGAERVLRMERQLRNLSSVDSLTGLWNRRTFFEQVQREWSRALRHDGALSCVLLDIDFFKQINDTRGHQVGDLTLKTVADVLMRRSRPSDLICRYGGEEFCAMLPDTREEGAAAWAERIRAELAKIEVSTGADSIRVTASFGVAERLDDTPTPQALIELADQALLVAKRSGRDRIVRYTSLHAPGAWRLPAAGAGPSPFVNVRARDVMSAIVLTLSPDETLDRAAEFLLQLRIGSAPVTNEEGRLVGIISEKDLMTAVHTPQSWSQKISDAMKTNVVCYDADVPAEEVFKFLCRVSIRRVVVVEDGRPIGVISRDSLLRWVHNWRMVCSKTAKEPESCGFVLRRNLQRIAGTVVERAHELTYNIRNENEDYVPSVVGEVTRIQDLMNDMLGQCQRTLSTDLWNEVDPAVCDIGVSNAQTAAALPTLDPT